MRTWLLAAAGDNADRGFADTPGIDWLPTVINVALHVFLVGSLFAFAYALYAVVREPKDATVRMGRYMALFLGALIVVGSQASDRSYTSFIIDSIGESRSLGFQFFGAVVPGVMGLALGYYLTRGLRKGNERIMRALIMVGTLCVTQFALMYAIALEGTGGELDATITPNIAFVAGLGLIFVLNMGVQPEVTLSEERTSKFRSMLGQIIPNRNQRDKKAPLVGGAVSEFHRD